MVESENKSKKSQWTTLLIIDSQAVKNTCNASVEEVSDITTDVIRAVRSKSAIAKERKKRNNEGLPVHSFRTLLEDLGTICLNKVRYSNSSVLSIN